MAHILVIDDETSIRIFLREILQKAGHRVAVAEDTGQALKMLLAKNFDVVLADINLPRRTGMNLLEDIKMKSLHVQVIGMTDEPLDETASQAENAGAFDYLSKPISREQLLKYVAHAARVKALDDECRRLTEENHRHQENLEHLVKERAEQALVRSERALKRSLLELEAIIEALPGMVAVVDRQFNTIVANTAVVERFGNSDKAEVLGRKCYKVRKGLDDVCPQCGVARAYETGQPVSRVSTPEEEKLMGIATKAYAIPLKDETGHIWGGVEVIMDVTDLRNKENILLENEKRLRHFKSAVESSSNAVSMLTADGHFYYRNSAFDALFGEVGTTPPSELFVDREIGNTVLETIGAGGEWSGEVKMVGKNKEILPILLHANAIKDDQNNVVGLVAVHTDLTELKQTAQELQHALILLEKTEEVGMSGGWSQNHQTGRQEWSQGEYRIHDLSTDVTPSFEVHLQCVHPEDRQRHARLFEEHLKSDETLFSQDYRIQTSAGTIKHIQSKYQIIRDINGQPLFVHGVDMDITNRKQGEQ
ncbi:MAG: response regulator [Sedimentisphaerales bacterium]|nr:response regulator [Sedimentisphaerales bacterium]